MRLFAGQLFLAVLILTVVTLVKYAGGYPDYVLPSFNMVASYLHRNWNSLFFLGLYTFGYSLLGLVLALTIAAVSAVATMQSRKLTEIALALGLGWQTFPILALAPLLFVMFGDGDVTRLIIVTSFAYFPCFLTFLAIGSQRVEALESFFEQIEVWPRGGRFALRLNHSGKTIETSVIGSAALALVGAVVAEFIGANYGIGYLIRQGQYAHRTEIMLAAIVTIGLLGACYFALVQRLVKEMLPGSAK